MSKIKKGVTFEQALKRLEDIVSKLEEAGVNLEDSMQLFVEGAELVEFCNKELSKAKLKIETVLPEGGNEVESDGH